MKILMICDHYPLSPRVKKIRESLIKLYPKSIIKVMAWNRNNEDIKEDYVVALNQEIGYGNRYKKLINLYEFMKKVRKEIKLFKPTYIHAIDFEMLVVASLTSRSSKIIYEVYDIKFFNNKIVNRLREKIEKFIITNRLENIILASPYFKKYYIQQGIKQKNIVTLNNKPSVKYIQNSKQGYMKGYSEIIKDKITIGFIGTIRYKDILLNLINATKDNEGVLIFLIGSGPDYEYFFNYVKSNNIGDKVIMTGRYDMDDLEEIYKYMDYIWAVYPNKDTNVKYAISNKFFESQVFNKKVIVANETFLGEEVIEKSLGYSVNPYEVKNIQNLINQFKKNIGQDINQEYIENMFWEKEERQLIKIYK